MPQRSPCLGCKQSIESRPMGKGCFVPLFRFHSQKPTTREGSQSVSPVTIPALTTIVDKQFKEDRTLCPVWALRYYLDQTKDLLFISFKKGHTSDIRPFSLSPLRKDIPQTSDPVPSLLGKNKLSYFVINKQINKPWTWSSQSA